MNIYDNQVRQYFYHTEPNCNKKHMHTAIKTNSGVWVVEHHQTTLAAFKETHPEWTFSRLYSSIDLALEEYPHIRIKVEYPTIEALEEKLGSFLVNPNPEDPNEETPDKFETYGSDIKFVLERLKTHPRTVFTMQDSDDGEKLILTGGYHLCNRIYYLITNEPVPLHLDYENICITIRDYENDND